MSQTKNPNFVARFTLALFVTSNWLYNTVITGEEGIADFSGISSEVFNDSVFYEGAYKQLSALVPDINNEAIVEEILNSKTLLFDKNSLKSARNLSEAGMKKSIEDGMSMYSLMVAKKIAESTIFDDEGIQGEYTVIDGSNNRVVDTTILLPMIFTVDSDTLDAVTRLFTLEDTSIVSEVLDKLRTDPKLHCFESTFKLLDTFSKI